jgi:hypothetical protein
MILTDMKYDCIDETMPPLIQHISYMNKFIKSDNPAIRLKTVYEENGPTQLRLD